MRFLKRDKFLVPILALWCFAILVADEKSDEKILATVGTKKITVKEFLDRSELTIRPNNFKDKNTTLNNLICEKILALEAERKREQLEVPRLQNMLKGIKEQLMRDKLYYEDVDKKVNISTQEISNAYKYSTREYEVEFFTIRDKELVHKITTALDSVPELSNELFATVGEALGEKPVHKINYKDPDDDVIHQALFSHDLDTGTVIGPLALSNGDHILMKVITWVNYPLISGEDQRVQWNKVAKKLHEQKAAELGKAYLAKVMKGKKLEFNRESFNTITKFAMEYYLNKKKDDSLNLQMTEIPSLKPDMDLRAPFFTIDGKVWSIKDFQKEVLSHPLVFRTTNIDSSNFQLQFKLAVVDMIRDYYLTQEAYKKKLDTSEDVIATTKMWEDSFLASNQLKSVMDSVVEHGAVANTDVTGKINYRVSYLQALQKKYSPMIKINYALFNTLSLTKIDMFAMRPGVPYPAAVPAFPAFILSENLDYAKKEDHRQEMRIKK